MINYYLFGSFPIGTWRIAGIENIIGGTWSHNMQKLVCTHYENSTTPKCLWTEILGGGPLREGHVAAPFPEDFSTGTFHTPEFAEYLWRRINVAAFILYFVDLFF